MLNVIQSSQAIKTKGCAVTYRSGNKNKYGTCPKSCNLNSNKSHSVEKIDLTYLKAVLDAVPLKGSAWTYTHFKLEDLPSGVVYSIKKDKTKTTINRSADSVKEAVQYVKNGWDAVVVMPYSKSSSKYFVKDGIKFVRCIAEYTNRGCKDCNWCQKKDRDFGVTFTAHGFKKLSVGKANSIGGCYASGGNVNIHWERLAEGSQELTDSTKLKKFCSSLYKIKLRHHVTGDIGREKKVLASD